MIRAAKKKIAAVPTPMAGLALAIASLGWTWESAAQLDGVGQIIGAVIASVLLIILFIKFVCYPQMLGNDLAHYVVGSVVPTFAMALMVVSKAVAMYFSDAAQVLWLSAVWLHLIFFIFFIYHRMSDFQLQHMLPSRFVPPVGIIVADLTFPGGAFRPLAESLLFFGMAAYTVMLPLMIYRLLFKDAIPDTAKATIAIMAAPASLSLAGYLTIVAHPSPVVIVPLACIAVIMTFVIYAAFFRLLRLPFSPGYAAFTFPMVIGATALYKTAAWMVTQGVAAEYVEQISMLATIELYVATLLVFYVSLRYLAFYRPVSKLFS